MTIKHLDIHYFKGLESVQIRDCGSLNAFIGKNNSGKSSILHAIDMAGLALSVRGWDMFQPKLNIKDLFSASGEFEIGLTYQDDRTLKIKANPGFAPIIEPEPDEPQRFNSLLILPDTGAGLLRREAHAPKWVMDRLQNREYHIINSLDILYAMRFYSSKNERGFTPGNFKALMDDVTHYFPDLEALESSLTEENVPTLTYTEYGKNLDILYSGTGLKHFLDVLLKTTISGASVVLIDEPEMGLHADLQRRFIEYLAKLANEKSIQIFLATQSQVIQNYADAVNFYRVLNTKGVRSVTHIPKEASHTLLGDLGVRPSDVFNYDICLLVEGASDVIFFEHVLRHLYKVEFDRVAITSQQYGGGAADGIVSGTINISNITPAQRYILWTHDRDAKPTEPPSTQATQFKNKIEKLGFICHVWARREIEYYFPESLHIAAQQGDAAKEAATLAILKGDQNLKYRKAAEGTDVCVPGGKYLRKLLTDHLTDKTDLDQEIRGLIENTLIPWSKEILGA